MKIGVFVRSPYNYDLEQASRESALEMVDPVTGEVSVSLTQQQFKEECDINTIVKRFGLTGELPEVVRVPVSGDFTGFSDYQSMLNAVRRADEAFMELPAEVRFHFANDPQRLMDAVSDVTRRPELERLGLLAPGKAPVPLSAAVPEPAATPPKT